MTNTFNLILFLYCMDENGEKAKEVKYKIEEVRKSLDKISSSISETLDEKFEKLSQLDDILETEGAESFYQIKNELKHNLEVIKNNLQTYRGTYNLYLEKAEKSILKRLGEYGGDSEK